MWRATRTAMIVTAIPVALSWLVGLGPSSAAGFSSRGPLLVASPSGRAMFDGPAFGPGERRTRCISVTDRGAGGTQVRLFATGAPSAIDPWMELVVTEAATGSCSSFRAGSVVFSGTLASFPRSYAGGIRDARPSWNGGESHAYRFSVRLRDDRRAAGLSAVRSFVWEARLP